MSASMPTSCPSCKSTNIEVYTIDLMQNYRVSSIDEMECELPVSEYLHLGRYQCRCMDCGCYWRKNRKSRRNG